MKIAVSKIGSSIQRNLLSMYTDIFSNQNDSDLRSYIREGSISSGILHEQQDDTEKMMYLLFSQKGIATTMKLSIAGRILNIRCVYFGKGISYFCSNSRRIQ